MKSNPFLQLAFAAVLTLRPIETTSVWAQNFGPKTDFISGEGSGEKTGRVLTRCLCSRMLP